MRFFGLASVIILLFVSGAMAGAPVTVGCLRCEYLENPVGIDVPAPRLSWVLESDIRGQRQTAYHILVASSDEQLANDRGDLWDSGKVVGDQTVHVVYAGKPLATRAECRWKVRVWDMDGKPSGWSRPASWSMGLLHPTDWQPAQWIAMTSESHEVPVTPHNGYHSAFEKSADVAKWVAIDLGKQQTIDAVRLHPAHPYDVSPDQPGYLFPVRFKIEVATQADFSDAKTVADQTAADVPNPGASAVLFAFPPTSAQHIRLTVTRLAKRSDAQFAFTLAEMEVLLAGKNVALDAAVTARDVIVLPSWAKQKLTDGRILSEEGNLPDPSRTATMFRKEFDLGADDIQRAVVSVTGLGLYELRLNGRKVGDHILAPEWTRYSRHVQYQTYDVTDLVRQGKNAVAAEVAGGWWYDLMQLAIPYGKRACLLMRLDVMLRDGTQRTIVTDPSWQATPDGPIGHTGIYFGEEYDATKELPGWDQPGFDAASWRPAYALPYPPEGEHTALVAQCNEPIRVIQERKPVAMTEPKPGVYVFDMGQNMVGWCRLTTDAPRGTKITVRYAEMLKEDGNIYTDNLRGADQINRYVWRGGEASLEPHFSYHGFRYVEVAGLAQPPNDKTIMGRVFHSATPDAGRFSCSSERITKLMHCVEWVQRGNMHSTPTDCPQRTERLGWTGDAQIFSQTAMYGRDMAAFYTKWMRDIRDSQADDGRFPDYAPHVADPNEHSSGVPGWSDAGVIMPWRLYQNYADTRILEEQFAAAKRWIDFVHSHNPNCLWQKNRGNEFNDWLNGDTVVLEGYPRNISAVPKEVFATAYFAHSTETLAKMAAVLGRRDDASHYANLFAAIKKAFNEAYVSPDGRIQGDTQAGYALALNFNLLEPSLRPKATEWMLQAISKYKNHLSTGIHSTYRIMLELTRNGRHDEAWRIINLRTVPSWGYMIDMGATTIWERWDGYVQGRGFQDPMMNSFNHWALGAVGEWVWRDLAGIHFDEERPGYQHFFVRPRPSEGLTWVKSEYDSIRGRIVSDWSVEGQQFTLHVRAPVNTTATVYLPAKDAASIDESGKPLDKVDSVKLLRIEDGNAVLTVGSGEYVFHATMPSTER